MYWTPQVAIEREDCKTRPIASLIFGRELFFYLNDRSKKKLTWFTSFSRQKLWLHNNRRHSCRRGTARRLACLLKYRCKYRRDRSAFVLCFIQLEKLLGFRVTSSPIDDCCRCDDVDGGGCSGGAVITGEFSAITGESLLINTNETSLVGLRSECACVSEVTWSADCHGVMESCLNGGTCHQRQQSTTSVGTSFLCKRT